MLRTLSRSNSFVVEKTSPKRLVLQAWPIRSPHFSILSLIATALVACVFASLASAQSGEAINKSPRAKAPEFSLAERYHANINLTQYWVSEKLDGVRAVWNGENFISRGGSIFRAPHWFTANFPKQVLDGELWIQRGGFQTTVSTVRKQHPVDEEWQSVTYQVFDLPDDPNPFNSRMLQLEKISTQYLAARGDNNKYLRLIPQQRVKNHRQLALLLNRLVAEGAEGLMLRHQGSYHRAGRTNDLLKYKPQYDAEAIVIAYRSGKGKYYGTTGSLLVQLPSGIRFHIGTGLTDKERVSPPPIGAVISFRYWGLTQKGIPRHASFLRIRQDADL